MMRRSGSRARGPCVYRSLTSATGDSGLAAATALLTQRRAGKNFAFVTTKHRDDDAVFRFLGARSIDVRVDQAAQRQRQDAGLAGPCQRFGLAWLQFKGRRLADHRATW